MNFTNGYQAGRFVGEHYLDYLIGFQIGFWMGVPLAIMKQGTASAGMWIAASRWLLRLLCFNRNHHPVYAGWMGCLGRGISGNDRQRSIPDEGCLSSGRLILSAQTGCDETFTARPAIDEHLEGGSRGDVEVRGDLKA